MALALQCSVVAGPFPPPLLLGPWFQIPKRGFAGQLKTLLDIISESDGRRTQEMRAAEAGLLGGIGDLLVRYRSQVVTACERYDETVKGGVLRYKGEVESVLRSEAEAKALQEAASIAPPPVPVSAPAPAPPRVVPPRSPLHPRWDTLPRTLSPEHSPFALPFVHLPPLLLLFLRLFPYALLPLSLCFQRRIRAALPSAHTACVRPTAYAAPAPAPLASP